MPDQIIINTYEAELNRLTDAREDISVRSQISDYFSALLNLMMTHPEFQKMKNVADVVATLARTTTRLLERDEENEEDVSVRAANQVQFVPAKHEYGIELTKLNAAQQLQFKDRFFEEFEKMPENNHRHLDTIIRCLYQLANRLENNSDRSITLKLVKGLLVLWVSKLETKIQNMYQLSLSVLNERVCVVHEHPDIANAFAEVSKQYGLSLNRIKLESIGLMLLLSDPTLFQGIKRELSSTTPTLFKPTPTGNSPYTPSAETVSTNGGATVSPIQ